MLAKEIDKSPDARTYRTVAVIDCTEWHSTGNTLSAINSTNSPRAISLSIM